MENKKIEDKKIAVLEKKNLTESFWQKKSLDDLNETIGLITDSQCGKKYFIFWLMKVQVKFTYSFQNQIVV